MPDSRSSTSSLRSPQATTVPAKLARQAYQMHGKGDPDEVHELVLEHLPLVKSIAGRFRHKLPTGMELDDLTSCGLAGLIQAARRYNPAQRSTFLAYAAQRIRGAMLDAMRKSDVLSRNRRSKARLLRSTREDLEQSLGRAATESELAKAMGLSINELSQLQQVAQSPTFLPLEEQDDPDHSNLIERLCDESEEMAPFMLEKQELVEELIRQIGELKDVPRKILAFYYFENMRFSEIARIFEVSESRISQIHSQTMSQLRLSLRRYLNLS